MDALDVLAVAVRRWYVSLTVVLLSVFAGLGLAEDRTPTYAATGDFAVIYRPQSVVKPGQADPREQNPMSPNGLLKASIVAALRSAESQKELGAKGVLGTDPSTAPDGSSYALLTDRNSDTVTVEAYGADRDRVEAVVQGVLEAAAVRARAIQDRVGAPADGRLTTFITLPTQVVRLPPASGTKLLIGVIAVGVITGAALSLLVDTALRKRRAGKERAAAETDEVRATPSDDSLTNPEFLTSRAPRGEHEAKRIPGVAARLQARPAEDGPASPSAAGRGAPMDTRSGISASG